MSETNDTQKTRNPDIYEYRQIQTNNEKPRNPLFTIIT